MKFSFYKLKKKNLSSSFSFYKYKNVKNKNITTTITNFNNNILIQQNGIFNFYKTKLFHLNYKFYLYNILFKRNYFLKGFFFIFKKI